MGRLGRFDEIAGTVVEGGGASAWDEYATTWIAAYGYEPETFFRDKFLRMSAADQQAHIDRNKADKGMAVRERALEKRSRKVRAKARKARRRARGKKTGKLEQESSSMGRFDKMVGLAGTVTEDFRIEGGPFDEDVESALVESKADIKTLIKTLNRIGLNLAIRSGDPRDQESIKRARKHLATAKTLAMGLKKGMTEASALTPDSESTGLFDKLVGLTEAYAFPKDQGDAALVKLTKEFNKTIAQARKLVRKGYAGSARTLLIKLGNKLQTVQLEDEDEGEDELAEAGSGGLKIKAQLKTIVNYATLGQKAVSALEDEISADKTGLTMKLGQKARSAFASIVAVVISLPQWKKGYREDVDSNTPSGDFSEGGARAAEPVADSRSDGSGQPGGEGHRMTPLPTPWQEEGATTTAGTDTVLTEQADATTEQPTTLDTVSAALGLDDVDDVDEGCGKPNSGDDEEDDEDVDDESAMEGESGATGSLRDKMLKIMAQSRIKIAHLIPAGKKGPAGLTLAAAKKLIKESVTEAKAKADGEAHGDDEMEEEQEEASASDADDDDTEEETRGEQERAATTAEADPQAEADDEQEEGSVFERLAGLDEAKDSAKFFASLSMSDLRKRQGIVKQQQATASEQYEAAKDPGTKRRMSRAVDKLAKTEAALTQAVAAKSKTTQGSRA